MSDYVKQTWVDEETPVDAEHLNHMEDGIEDAQAVAITGINVNGESAPVTDHVASIEVDAGIVSGYCETATGTSAKRIDDISFTLENGYFLAITFLEGNTCESITLTPDVGSTVSVIGDARCPENSTVYFAYSEVDNAFIVDAGLTRANEANDAIPTKVSELDNDVPYATQTAVEEAQETASKAQNYAEDASSTANSAESRARTAESTASEALTKANEVADSAITAITVNGEDVPVEDNKAEITVSGESAIEHIQVNGEEQPIEDKTVNLAIDRASVDGETLIVGDTTGGGANVSTGSIPKGETFTAEWGYALIVFRDSYGDNAVYSVTKTDRGSIPHDVVTNPDFGMRWDGNTMTAECDLDYMAIHE